MKKKRKAKQVIVRTQEHRSEGAKLYCKGCPEMCVGEKGRGTL